MREGSFRTDDQIRKAIGRYARLIYALAYSRTRNRADAEDVFQEVFLRYARRDTPFVSEEHERAWLIRVTANLSVNLIASAWRRRALLRAAPPAGPRERTRPNDALNEALDRLPESYRAVVHLYYYEDMTADEIAAALDLRGATVRKRLARGRAKLKEMLEEAKGHA